METKVSKRFIWMLVAIFLGYSCVYVDKTTIGMSLVTISQDLGFDPQQKGMILSSFFLGYTILQIPFGYLANKVGTRKILIMSITLIGLFLVLFGFGFSFFYLVFIRFATGALAHSGYPSSVSKFISQELPAETRGPAQSAMIASSGFASIVGPLAIAPLLTQIGWHKTYYLIGAIVVLIAILMYFSIPKEYGGVKQDSTKQKSLPFTEVLKDPNVWILLFSAFFINASIYGLINWMPTYLVEAYKISLGKTAIVTAVMGFFTFIAGMFGGMLVKKFFLGKEKVVVFTAVVGASVFVILMAVIKTFLLNMVFLNLAVLCASFAFATLMSFPVKLFPSEEVSEKYATINALGVSGGFFAPSIIGALIKFSNGQFFSSFLFIAISFVISGIITLMIRYKIAEKI